MSLDLFIAVLIFLITYIAIVSEKVHRTVAALIGAMMMIIFIPGFTQEVAFDAIDLNVIFLLMGMMVIAHILSETGVFQWLAVRAVLLGKGNPVRILQLLAIITAVTSAALDNVTVVVLIAPITLFVASSLGISAIPFLIAEVLASNIGGTATLIGDPPNILIGSAAGIGFTPFLLNAGPFILVALIVFVLLIPLVFGRSLRANRSSESIQIALEEQGLIDEPILLRKSLIVLSLVFLGFLFHSALEVETATVALLGAAILLLWTRRNPHDALQTVEWPTLVFFIGLFILVEGLVYVGAISAAANWLLDITGGDLAVTSYAILWASALLSGIIDNIPYTATMIPLIQNLGDSGMNTWPLWWALVFGADLGGNLTVIGASANVVVASMAERSGHPISFGRFLIYGVIVTFVMMVMATIYLGLRYL
ncbi:MAG: ArsB/NhaD family transporter [Caldilineales bacterium]|nr:ArsB/NhaD family transporter [Caldilineales bacterium]